MIAALLLLCADLNSDVEEYLDTVVVTATRLPTVAFDTPYAVDVVSGKEIQRRAYRTVPQAMRNIPGVMVQETAMGQGSPFIRGFTGFRNLFLIDGIRLNNSVFRSGPNQYWSTVDALSLDRLEVVKGPSSVLYGSDAIGGTVNAITLSPYGNGGRVYARGATAEHSLQGRAEGSGAFGDFGVLVGLTGKDFGDLTAGDPTGRQTETGYEEWAGDVKIEYFLDDDTRAILAYQHVDQNNVPRTHRTVFAVPFHGTTVGTELQRDLDQRRDLLYAQFHQENREGAVKTIRASLSWHEQSETRDRIRPPDRRDMQGFTVGTIGFWIQGESSAGRGTLTYGIEYYHDNVNSFSSRNPVQGPVADDASYDLLGAFVQDTVVFSEQFEATFGVRVTYAAVDAKSVADPVTGLPIRIKDSWSAVTGSVRVLFHVVPEEWNLFAGVSQGFRAPNLSDLTRLDSARTNEFEVASPGLDPERYLAFEFGAKGRTGNLSLQAALFYTLIRDQIVRVPTGAVNGDGESIITKSNVGDGYMYGLEVGAAWRVSRFTIFGNLTWMEGKVDTFPTSAPVAVREYIDRLMPLTGQIGVRWEYAKYWVEVLVMAADKADRLSTRDAGDTSRIPPGGTPGYAVVHIRGGVMLWDKAALSLGIGNVLDKSYRVHGSGQNMAGLNFIVSVNFRF